MAIINSCLKSENILRFKTFKNMTLLILENCQLSYFPTFLYYDMLKLEKLSFANNPEFKYLSPSIHVLKSLKYLDISCTGIELIPQSIVLLKDLQVFLKNLV